MKQFLDVTQQLTKLTNNLWETNKKIQKAMIPPKVVHWKTPLLLSIFLALLSVAAVTDWRTRTLIFDMSWLFFTLSMGLLTSQAPFVINRVSLSPWVTSILIGLWLLIRLPADMKEIAWISGPLIAVVVHRGRRLRSRRLHNRYVPGHRHLFGRRPHLELHCQ